MRLPSTIVRTSLALMASGAGHLALLKAQIPRAMHNEAPARDLLVGLEIASQETPKVDADPLNEVTRPAAAAPSAHERIRAQRVQRAQAAHPAAALGESAGGQSGSTDEENGTVSPAEDVRAELVLGEQPGPGGCCPAVGGADQRADGSSARLAEPLGGNPAPNYPAAARRAGIEGHVLARLFLLADGSVEHVQILQGAEIFHESVVNSLARWRFMPARKDGTPVASQWTVRIPFALR